MEKIIIFLPIIIFFGFFGLLVFGFLLLVFKLIKKGKDSHWEGILIDKKYVEKRDYENRHKINHFYTLIFKTTDDKETKVGVSKEIYDSYKLGNKTKKVKGKLFIEKIS